MLSGMADATTATDNSGQFAFTGLRAGSYSVEISGFDMDEVGFGNTSSSATVGVGESKILTFDGTYLRTAGIMGQVSVEGVGLPGVTVTMTGEGEDETDVTDAGGLYGFSKLKAGTYSIAISGYDPDEVEFQTTSKTVTVALGETANEPFEGTLLRTSGISGRVSVEGMGLDDVEVTLAGAAEATTMTSGGGQYAFAGLAEGTYVVSMMNPDANAYNFEETSATIVLGDSESNITNFDGTHTRTASISGVLFVDEVLQDKMHTAGEPSLTAALAPLVEYGLLDPAMVAGLLEHAKVIIRGPSLNDPPMYGQIQLDGSFTVGELVAGSYQVELPVNNDMVAAALAAAGVDFVGESMVVQVAAGGGEIVNFPFRITMQTIGVGAVMGSAEMVSDPPVPVGGVTLALFPTAQDAAAGTNELAKLPIPTMTGETGMAAFQFARADDTSPGSEDTDNIVFVKVLDAGHEDLMVSDGNVIEVQYPGVARVHAAPTSVRFQNVAVNFQFWIKNDADARGGDMLVDGWHTQVFMGDSEDALMMEDEDGDTVNLTMPSESAEDEDGMQGRVMVSHRVTPDQLPATFNVALRPDTDDWQQPMAMGETWEEVGDGLTYTHTGFEHPLLNTHQVNDLNLNPRFGQAPARVTFTTQKLTVGVYREADDVAGFSDFQSRVSAGDHRPAADVAKELSVSVMVEASGRRGLEVYDEWDHDRDPDTDAIDATITGLTGGMATFGNLPADMEFTVQFSEGSDRVTVGGPDSRSDRVQAYGDDIELGKSTGAFGDMSGAGPEVELCPLTTDTRPSSLGDDDSDCATFAYQWATGSITGDVGRAVKDLDVGIEADTDLHSEAPRETETDKDGDFSWSGVQDGVYSIAVTSSDDYTVKPKSVRVDVYHDEFEDDDDEDTDYIGTAGTDHADFTATRLRLSIKGYVANVSHEENEVVRGDETYEGAELELYAYEDDDDAKTKIDKTGPLLATAEVAADGLYEFNDLVEGAYVIVAKNTDDYEMYHDGPDVHYRNNIPAHLYGQVGEERIAFPSWDYEESDVINQFSLHDVNDDGRTDFVFFNFALLHGDGEFSGRVREARGDPEGIAVELRRCEETELDDDDDAESCTEELAFDAQTDNAGKTGLWSFPSLREGYYVANIAATTYNRAKWRFDASRRAIIDDDAPNCMGTATPVEANCDGIRTTDLYGLLQGDDAFNRGGATFYVYNRTLSDADELTKLVVIGDPDADSVGTDITHGNGSASNEVIAIPDTRTGPMTALTQTRENPREVIFEGGVVEVKMGTTGTRVSPGAAYTVRSYTTDPTRKASHSDGKVQLDVEPTGELGKPGAAIPTTIEIEVEAANGYDDHAYTFMVQREAPVDNNLTFIAANPNRSRSGDWINIQTSDNCYTPRGRVEFGEGCDEYRATVPSGEDKVYLFAQGKAMQLGIAASLLGDGTALTDLGGQHNRDRPNESVFEVEVPATGVIDERVEITVTSEDGVDKVYFITLNRDRAQATLTALNLSDVTLDSEFTSTDTYYLGGAATTVTQTTVTWEAANGITVTISPEDADPSTAAHEVALVAGEFTRIQLHVSGTGIGRKTYTVDVMRAEVGASDDATLSSLTLSDGDLSPDFDPAVTTYTASVENAVSEVTVTPTTNHSSATFTQIPDNPVGLEVDVAREITVTVTAEDGTMTETYTVTVTREEPGVSSDADLRMLELSAGTLSPDFDPAVTTYTANVENAVSEVTVTAPASHSSASVAQDPGNPVALDVGDTPITVTVTAQDGTTKAYTVTVTRSLPGLSSDADLGDLSLSDGELSPDFDPAVTTYTANVENAVSEVTVTAPASHSSASVAQDPGNPVALDVGDTPITVTVTAQDGTTKAYTVTVTRSLPGLSSDADLGDLSLSDGELSPDFDPAVTTYTANVENAVSEVTVTAPASHSSASVAQDPDNPVALDEGDTPITVTVTAQDGTTKAYTVTVTRAPPAATPGLDISTTELTVGEGEETTYIVKLATEPSARVVVVIAGATDGVTLDGETTQRLGFTASNWFVGATVTVMGTEDADTDNQVVTLTHTAESSDTDYNDLVAVEVEVTVTDDDAAGASVTVSPNTLTIEEGAEDSYTIVLAAVPLGDVTVTVAGGDGLSVSPMELTFTTANFETEQTVTVIPEQDDDVMVPDPIELTHTAEGGGYGDVATIDGVTVNGHRR